MLFLLLLALAAGPFFATLRAGEAVAATFDVAVFGFVLTCIPLWHDGAARQIRLQAQRDDAGQGLLLLLTSLVTAAVFTALATLKLESDHLGAGGVILVVLTLVASWSFANLIYAFHYARLYYSQAGGGDHKGLEFPGDAEPAFADFVNFAFVIGMTCQTADIAIRSSRMRKIATFHGLFAFAFNLGILALCVNVLASLGGGGY